MSALDLLTRQLPTMVFAQATRMIERIARKAGRAGEIGADSSVAEEPGHFIASDRMALPANDLADIARDKKQVRLTTNLLGLAGAAPALPPTYSEMLLQRRRLRDRSFAAFLNIFDHRALSFFYRIFRKYNWAVSFEREAVPGTDPASRAVLAIAGLGTPGSLKRLAIEDAALIPLAPHLGDARRSAASVETVLRTVTGHHLRVVESEATWLPLPVAEQTRLGGSDGRFTRLGGVDAETGMGALDTAIIGTALLDVQHHYAIEIGPLSHHDLIAFCKDGERRRIVGETCMLAAGMEHQPVIRLLIETADIPPLQLANDDTPALLGWTSWLGSPGVDAGTVADCVIPIDRIAIGNGN